MKPTECNEPPESVADVDLDELVDGEFDFYGADEIGQRFRLDDVTYELIEVTDTAYHVQAATHPLDGLPIARVTVECDGLLYKVVDLHDGYEWVQFGVADADSYAPYVVFDYFPKGPGD